jgi:hypothetical protein
LKIVCRNLYLNRIKGAKHHNNVNRRCLINVKTLRNTHSSHWTSKNSEFREKWCHNVNRRLFGLCLHQRKSKKLTPSLKNRS